MAVQSEQSAVVGGQFERLVGLFKRAFNKTIGAGLLTYPELCDVVINVEVELNNRPLNYVEDDPLFPQICLPCFNINNNTSQIFPLVFGSSSPFSCRWDSKTLAADKVSLFLFLAYLFSTSSSNHRLYIYT